MSRGYGCAIVALAGLIGCAQYTVPGPGAEMGRFALQDELSAEQMRDMTDGAVQSVLDRRPLAAFPTGLAVARVQASGYRSHRCTTHGHGAYSVVTSRDIETEDHHKRLASMPMVRGIAPVSSLLLPEQLQSDRELRRAAAAMHADILLLYTLNTQFHSVDKPNPLHVVTLGLLNGETIRVNTTASALLLDTRTGYVYGVAEATHTDQNDASSWTDEEVVDDSRRRTELAAFENLLGQLERVWGDVVRQYAVTPQVSPPTAGAFAAPAAPAAP